MHKFLATLSLIPGILLAGANDFRPPAVPLVVHDPYFSIWSITDRLTDSETHHWTGTPQALTSLVRVDGKSYRIMGKDPRSLPAIQQTSVQVLPTRTIYQFSAGGVRLTLTFLTPALPEDLDVLSRPVTYINWLAEATDGIEHHVAVYFDASADVARNTHDQQMVWSRLQTGNLEVLRIGTQQQPVLEKYGDNLRIDWGYFYVAAAKEPGIESVAAPADTCRNSFEQSGRLPDTDDFSAPRPNYTHAPVLAFRLDLGKVGVQGAARHLMVAYDDVFSIEYFERKLRPYWRRNGAEAQDLLRQAWIDYPALAEKSKAFDESLMADLKKTGGDDYAALSALAYRQTLAAHKLAVDADGTPLLFPKENFSNGCIGTVDVFYPSSPFFLLLNPALLRAQLEPILQYSAMGRWRFPFAPHDLGTYPRANGQVYGGGEKTEENQMPVEESGNMLILSAALAQIEGNSQYAAKYWPVLAKWAEYLRERGLDPENQLSTDDFAGHLAHNANLSLKAIVALGSYANLCEMSGKADEARVYRKTAEDFAEKWVRLAAEGDHYRLAFDKPGTWSQKYNLVWDRILGLGLFPPEVSRKEIAFYLSKQNKYGLPLDNRRTYTKLDWIVWTATLADSKADFEALVTPALKFADETSTRVPLSDWYDTVSAKQQGFQARSVVGGIFIKMLSDRETWKKWASRAQTDRSGR